MNVRSTAAPDRFRPSTHKFGRVESSWGGHRRRLLIPAAARSHVSPPESHLPCVERGENGAELSMTSRIIRIFAHLLLHENPRAFHRFPRLCLVIHEEVTDSFEQTFGRGRAIFAMKNVALDFLQKSEG